MMHLAEIAAPHFDAAEVIEMHHATKLDAPSGTRWRLRKARGAARTKPFSHHKPEKTTSPEPEAGRGGVGVHSVPAPRVRRRPGGHPRLPGRP